MLLLTATHAAAHCHAAQIEKLQQHIQKLQQHIEKQRQLAEGALLSTLPVSLSFDGCTGATAEDDADEEAMEEEQVCIAAVSDHVCVLGSTGL